MRFHCRDIDQQPSLVYNSWVHAWVTLSLLACHISQDHHKAGHGKQEIPDAHCKFIFQDLR